MNKLKTLTIILVFIFLGCTGNDRDKEMKNPETVTLKPVKKIERIGDSLLLSLVTNMNAHNGRIYMTDHDNHRIVGTDTNYRLVQVYGRQGNGPFEFNFAGGAIVNQGKLYAVDEGHQRINVCTLNGRYLESIKGPVPSSGRFIIQDSVYYGSLLHGGNEPPLFKANLEGKVLKRFGTHERVLSKVNQHASRRSFFCLEQWKDQILAICETDPVIERYTLNGEFIDSLNLSKLEFLQPRIEHTINKQKQKARTGQMVGTTGFFHYSCLQGNKLYLLLYGFDETINNSSSHHVLVLEITRENLSPIKLYNLKIDGEQHAWYTSFCIVGKKLIAFDGRTYELHEYRLPV